MSFDILTPIHEPQRRIIIINSDDREANLIKDVVLGGELGFSVSVYVTADVAEAGILIKQFKPECILATDLSNELLIADSAKILICSSPDFITIKDAINNSGVFRILFRPLINSDILSSIRSAVEYTDITRRNSALIAKAEARNRYLLDLKESLENKGKEQLSHLSNFEFTVKGTNTEYEIMNQVLSSLQGVNTIQQIHDSIKRVLVARLGITAVEIRTGSITTDPLVKGTITLPLFCSGCSFGEITFKRSGFFSASEIDLLEKISDVVAMSVEKSVRFYALEKIKKQWESAFDSIDDPIVIIDESFNILRANKAFADAAKENLKDIANKKCYDVFQTNKTKLPCVGCNIRTAFDAGNPVGSEVTAQSGKRFYTTWSYPIMDSGRVTSAVHFYKDISDQISYRERLVYSEKLAEIGILAGSVAHEINNPIGGIIALLQIIISEAEAGNGYLNDLTEMERAAQRCKHIVDNLLHFARTSKDEEVKLVDFSSVINTLFPLIQLQIRHENISIDISSSGEGLFVKAVFNELVQSLLNIVNTSIELISKRPGKGDIKISVERDGSMLLVELIDDGIPLQIEGTGFGSLALFVTEKIVKGYRGMSYFENINGKNRYRLYFPLSVNATSDISRSENEELRS